MLYSFAAVVSAPPSSDYEEALRGRPLLLLLLPFSLTLFFRFSAIEDFAADFAAGFSVVFAATFGGFLTSVEPFLAEPAFRRVDYITSLYLLK